MFMTGWKGKSSRRKGEQRRDSSWRRAGNVYLMDLEDKSLFILHREMWRQKKAEEAEILFRDIEEVKEFSRKKMFGR